jgi:hypothetical protein
VSRGLCCCVGVQILQVALLTFCKWVSVIGNNSAIAYSQFIVWPNCNFQRFKSPCFRTVLFSVTLNVSCCRTCGTAWCLQHDTTWLCSCSNCSASHSAVIMAGAVSLLPPLLALDRSADWAVTVHLEQLEMYKRHQSTQDIISCMKLICMTLQS